MEVYQQMQKISIVILRMNVLILRLSVLLSAFAENHDRKIVNECESFSASAGFRSRRSERRRCPERKLVGASSSSPLIIP